MLLRNLILLIIALSGVLAAQSPLTEPETNIPEGVVIDADAQPTDEKIQTRLESIFGELEGLKEVEVSVKYGIVTLRGSVPNGEAANEAVALTEHTKGVVYVRNQLEDSALISSRLEPAKEKATKLGREVVRKLPLILIAAVAFALFWLLAKWFGMRENWFRKWGMHELSAKLLARTGKLVIIALGILIVLEILDATAVAGAVLGVAGVAGIALGFAFRNIVENYLAGILLGLRNPFNTGDAISVEDYSGKVVRLTSRDTVLMTPDGNHIRLPNSLLMTSPLTNFSRNALRRFEFAIGVSVELDLNSVRELGLSALQEVKGILTDPAPLIVIEELGDSTVNMRFFAWIDQRESDYLKTKSEAIRRVKVAFDDNDVEMPEPIYRVVMKRDSAPSKEPTNRPVIESTPSADEEQDTAVDKTIDKQLQEELSQDDEANLLAAKS
ncbi:mechanosensitive ion channel family protein [Roseibacillus persicicus]|uniref:mechanosensitive ion channel family protein n=1 Tax=Roseibacillus persicicus TaxID=454148 RepID=UPI00280D8C90|nr:mechanosensitive ion channel family protein [Roseibacillus persicicus]MDQ8192178.1 mechanosensitive ion channel family protein [Roseibacillus persicicus]